MSSTAFHCRPVSRHRAVSAVAAVAGEPRAKKLYTATIMLTARRCSRVVAQRCCRRREDMVGPSASSASGYGAPMGHKRARTGEVREVVDDSAAIRRNAEQKRMHGDASTPCTKFKPHASRARKDPPRASNDRTRPKTPECPQLPCK